MLIPTIHLEFASTSTINIQESTGAENDEIVPPQQTFEQLKADVLMRSSFKTLYHSAPDIDVEMIVNYPLDILWRILPLTAQFYEQLDRLGKEKIGIAFGYDVLPETMNFDDPADADIFTGIRL